MYLLLLSFEQMLYRPCMGKTKGTICPRLLPPVNAENDH